MSDNNNTEGASAPSEPSAPEKAFSASVTAMDTLGAAMVLAMMVMVNIDVFGRWLLNSPLAGTLELTELGIVAIVFLQLAYTVRARRLTRSDTFLDYLGRKNATRVTNSMRLFFNLCGAFILAAIAYGQLPRLIDAWTRGYFKGNVGIFTAPTWPFETILLVGATVASIQFLFLAYGNLKHLRSTNK